MEKKEVAVKEPSKQETLLELFKAEKSDIKAEQIAEVVNALKAFGVAKDLNISQMYLFIKYCQKLKLNPLLKEIHCVCYKNRDGSTTMTPIVSYMEYIKRAEKHPNYQLPELDLVDVGPDGKPLPLNQIYIEAKVQRKGETSVFKKRFYLREWRKETKTWNEQPINMLYVRAMKNILANAYPNEVSHFEALEQEQDVYLNEHKSTKIDYKKVLADEDTNN